MKGYSGYKLSERDRGILAKQFPPKYPKFVGHHVTTAFGTSDSDPLPPTADRYEIVGYTDSGDGLEALVVSIDGNTTRPDGSIYHITWSLDPAKYSPKNSNDLVKEGFESITPIEVDLVPTFFPFGR